MKSLKVGRKTNLPKLQQINFKQKYQQYVMKQKEIKKIAKYTDIKENSTRQKSIMLQISTQLKKFIKSNFSEKISQKYSDQSLVELIKRRLRKQQSNKNNTDDVSRIQSGILSKSINYQQKRINSPIQMKNQKKKLSYLRFEKKEERKVIENMEEQYLSPFHFREYQDFCQMNGQDQDYGFSDDEDLGMFLNQQQS